MALPVRVERTRAADPFEMVRRDFNVINRLLGGGFFGDQNDSGPMGLLGGYGVDIREDADHIYIEADLPGFRREEVNVSLDNGTLTIEAEHQEEITEPGDGQQTAQTQGQQQGKGGEGDQKGDQGQRQGKPQQPEYLLRERRVQRFVRSFTLPPNVDEQSVQAKLENGVLRVTLNKREDAKPKRIQLS
jgi:HSP20 family protein